MAITLRSQKGASLTFTELDGNFIDLNTRLGDVTQRVGTLESDTVTWDEIQDKPNTLDGFGLEEVFDGNYNNLTNKPVIPSVITDLENVSSSVVPSTGQVLKWDGLQWAPANEEGAGNVGVDLTAFSVSVHPPEGAPNLTYDNTTGEFQYTPPNLALYALAGNLSTVASSGDYNDLANIPALADVAESGLYSDLSGRPNIPFNVGDLNNVSSSSPTIGQVLGWNGSTWSPTTVEGGSGGGATTLDGLTDVSTSGVVDTNVLKFNAGTSSWTVGQVSFNELSNTPTTLAGYGITDASTFDGAFSSLTGTPTTLAGYGITDAFDGAFSSLSSTPTTISGYGITDAFDGEWVNILSKPTTLSGYGITDGLVSTAIGDFTFTGTTLDTAASAAITVTPDITFNGTVTISSLASVGTGNLAFTSAASVNITATDDINLSATNITGLGNEAYDTFATSTTYNPGGAVAHGSYIRNEADTADVAASVTVTSGFSKVKVELDASIANITDATTEMLIALERTVDGLNPTTVKIFLFPVANTFYGSQHFLYVDTHSASAGSTVEYKLKVDMSSYSNESARVQYGICGDTLYIKEIR